MSKRGSRNAERLSRFFSTEFDAPPKHEKDENQTNKKQFKTGKEAIHARLDPNEIVSTTRPLRRGKKEVKVVATEGNKKIKRPADNTQAVLVSTKESMRRTTKKFKPYGITNREEGKHSHTDYYKNRKRKRAKGIMVDPNRLGRSTKKERKQRTLEKILPFAEDN